MAKKKLYDSEDAVSEEEAVLINGNAVTEEPAIKIEETVEQAPAPKDPEPEPEPVKKVVEKPKPAVVIDVEAELQFAQQQIERCLDYVEIPGADYKGRFRPSLKEWRLYKYKLRQHARGNGPAPVRPTVVEDY